MEELWTKLLTIDDLGFTLVVIMAIVAAFLVRELLGGWMLTLVGFPCLLLAALGGHAMFREFGIAPATDQSSNLLVGAVAGMIVGLTVYVIIVQVVGRLCGR